MRYKWVIEQGVKSIVTVREEPLDDECGQKK